MSLSDKIYVIINRYVRRVPPRLDDDLRRYLLEELRVVEASMASLTEATPQVVDALPKLPRIGTIRYFEEVVIDENGTDPAVSGLHVYTENGWQKITIE